MNPRVQIACGAPRCRFWPVLVLCALLPWLPSTGRAEPLAGTVTFALGSAQVLGAGGAEQGARVGTEVHVGDSLRTGADGWLHLRLVDDAFVALRPGSTLRITRYAYDPDHPQRSVIRLDLDQGNARTVSGRGGEAARRSYRFGTPLAAIGLRGTDYTVRVFDEVTRVSVRRGAVQVTPLGEGCSVVGDGPCQTALTRELAAQTPHAYLELRAHQPAPSLVLPEQDPKGAEAQNPPGGPAEPLARAGGPETHTGTVGEVQADQAVASGAVPPAPAPPPPPPALVWGRWSQWAAGPGAPSVVSLLDGERDVTVGNTVFGLLRGGGPVDLPTQGEVSFRLANSEAYLLSGGELNAAQVRDGGLSIDFRQRTFDTSLAVQYPGGRESLQASGAVQFQGFLIADPARSSMNLQGALSRDGAEAAYLFDKPVNAGTLLGATRWLR